MNGEIWEVRTLGCFKRRRCDHDNQSHFRLEYVQQCSIRCGKVIQQIRTAHRFQLAKLSDHNSRVDHTELCCEISESFPTPAVFSPSFNHGSLAKDSIGLPRQITKFWARGRECSGENRLQVSRSLEMNHVGTTNEYHNIVIDQLESFGVLSFS